MPKSKARGAEVSKRQGTEENERLIRDIHEEVMLLRAATQAYTALLEQFLAAHPPRGARPAAGTLDIVPPSKEVS